MGLFFLPHLCVWFFGSNVSTALGLTGDSLESTLLCASFEQLPRVVAFFERLITHCGGQVQGRGTLGSVWSMTCSCLGKMIWYWMLKGIPFDLSVQSLEILSYRVKD